MRHAVVTGVGGGIGRTVAALLGNHGWSVFGIDIIQSGEDNCKLGFLRFDLAEVADIPEACQIVRKRVSSLDLIVNNAACQIRGPVSGVSVEDWYRSQATNVAAPLFLVKHLYPILVKPGGAIINIASVHALMSSPGNAAYAATKGALVSLTRSMSLEFGQEGVRVNAILPGAIDTPMLRAAVRDSGAYGEEVSDADLIAALGSKYVLGRVGTPLDVAQAVLFLADGRKSGFITGQSLVVDGGVTARLSA